MRGKWLNTSIFYLGTESVCVCLSNCLSLFTICEAIGSSVFSALRLVPNHFSLPSLLAFDAGSNGAQRSNPSALLFIPFLFYYSFTTPLPRVHLLVFELCQEENIEKEETLFFIANDKKTNTFLIRVVAFLCKTTNCACYAHLIYFINIYIYTNYPHQAKNCVKS